MATRWLQASGSRRWNAAARRVMVVALLVWLVAAAGPASLGAHAELLRSEPAAGAVLPAAPALIRLWFSEPVDPPPDAVTVIGPDGARADGRDSRIMPGDEGGIDLSLNAQAQGTYVVRWRVISADSHPISGEFRFSVGQPSETVVALPDSAPPGGNGVALQATARWSHLLGLALLVGPLLLQVLAAGLSVPRAIEASLWRGSARASLLLLASLVLTLIAQTAAVSGSVAAGLAPAALDGLLHTKWGLLWLLRAVLVVGLVAITHAAARRSRSVSQSRRWLVSVATATLGLVALTTLNSHSAATTPVWLSLGVDAVHVGATVVWLGGLCALAMIGLPAVHRLSADDRHALLARLVSRFSVVGLVAVELLVITGLYHAWAHVSNPSALVSTPYGRTLLVKLLLFVATLLPAGYNLLVARPRLTRARERVSADVERGFSRAVRSEALIGVFVLAAVGMLTSLPPAHAAAESVMRPKSAAAAEPAVTVAGAAGRYLVTVSLGPGRVGSNQLRARLQDERGAPVVDIPVRLRIIPPADSQIPPWVVVPARTGESYQATVAFAPAGRWRVEVEVMTPGDAPSTTSFPFSVPLLGAGELLAAATERMNGLRSVREATEMVADGVPSTGFAQHRAPLEYQWMQSASEVILLGREVIDGEECFVVGYVDTRDGSRVRVWIATRTLLVVQRSSAGPGHVHLSRFSQFEAR